MADVYSEWNSLTDEVRAYVACDVRAASAFEDAETVARLMARVDVENVRALAVLRAMED